MSWRSPSTAFKLWVVIKSKYRKAKEQLSPACAAEGRAGLCGAADRGSTRGGSACSPLPTSTDQLPVSACSWWLGNRRAIGTGTTRG